MAIKPPCKGCEKRHEHCHMHCESYLEFQNENKRLKEERERKRLYLRSTATGQDRNWRGSYSRLRRFSESYRNTHE